MVKDAYIIQNDNTYDVVGDEGVAQDEYIIEDKYIKYNLRVQFWCSLGAFKRKKVVNWGKRQGKTGKDRKSENR